MKLKRVFAAGLVCFVLAGGDAFATRYMQQKEKSAGENGESRENGDDRFQYDSGKDYENIYYSEDIPGTRKNLYDGYKFNGEQVKTPDLSKFSEFSADRITNFSDAIVNYIGWDSVLGETGYDLENDILTFNGTSSTVATEKCFGYSGRKFGCEPLEFDLMISSEKENYDGFLGIGFLMSETQKPNWSTGDGYMVCIKNSQVEFQQYHNGQNIVKTVDTKAFSANEWHKVIVDTKLQGETKVTTLTVDGKQIFVYEDNDGAFVPSEGYINFLCYAGDKISIRPTNATIKNHGTEQQEQTKGVCLKIGSNTAVADGKSTMIDASDAGVVPYIENNRTMVPLRFLAEVFGGYVSYDESLKKITIMFDECDVEITQGFFEYKVNDDYHASDTLPQIKNGRTFVPVRVISEAPGKNVEFADNYVFVSDSALTEEEKDRLKAAEE